MTTTLRPSPAPVTRPAGRVPTRGWTAAGVGLQVTWLAVIAYAMWAAEAGPEHPTPPLVLDVLLQGFGLAALATAAGLVLRRRWALWTSTALALPMVALAVMCRLAEAGNHWIAEAILAVGVVVGSLHPASWRMHRR